MCVLQWAVYLRDAQYMPFVFNQFNTSAVDYRRT